MLWLLYAYLIITLVSLNNFYRLVFGRDKHAFCKTELGAFKYYLDEYILQSVESVIVWNVLTNLRNSRLLSASVSFNAPPGQEEKGLVGGWFS